MVSMSKGGDGGAWKLNEAFPEAVGGRGMPRQVRIEFEGAMDHVMARGDRREAIVSDDGDRRTFVRTLGEAGGSLAESRTELFKDGTARRKGVRHKFLT